MKCNDQLVHIEEFRRDGLLYRITVHQVQNKLNGRWSCEACSVHGDEYSPTHQAAADCVTYTKGFADSHHREKYGRSSIGTPALFRSTN